jgi:hypothetical protein
MLFNFRDELSRITPKIADGARVYVFGCSLNWEHVRKQYRYLVDIDINQCIDGFIDNDKNKQGTIFHGLPVYALENISTENAVVIISAVSPDSNLAISEQLSNCGMYAQHSFFFSHIFFDLLMRWEYVRLSQFKDKHKGQRCFIVGTGPSLNAADLEKIKNEYSFASNRIYLMFNKTAWRPTYYAVEDDITIKRYHRDIKEHISCPVFYALNSVVDVNEFSLRDSFFYYLDSNGKWTPPAYAQPVFSEEAHILQWGATVTYACLQLAVYMGFTEIYLIGMDNSYPLSVKDNGELIFSDVNAYFEPVYTGNQPVINIILADRFNAAYKSAQGYAEQNGIKIRNATRGGKLEEFERVDLTSLF